MLSEILHFLENNVHYQSPTYVHSEEHEQQWEAKLAAAISKLKSYAGKEVSTNNFRAADAIEFVRAIDRCEGHVNVARLNAKELNERMKAMEARGEMIPSYLLAAYCGYECVIDPAIMIVKLDDKL